MAATCARNTSRELSAAIRANPSSRRVAAPLGTP
jgi:hypothetical protein